MLTGLFLTGRWRFHFEVAADAAEPDDDIEISGAIGKTSRFDVENAGIAHLFFWHSQRVTMAISSSCGELVPTKTLHYNFDYKHGE